MKKIFTFFLSALMGCSMYAQESADRMVIHSKSGNTKSYLVERIDSMKFAKVEGDVAADIKILDVQLDKVTFEILRTKACQAFKFTVLPKTQVNMLTNDAVLAEYIDENSVQMYWNDFTAGEISTDELDKGTDYVGLTLGFDELGTPCSVCRVDFKTLTPPLVGNPKVEYKIDSIGVHGFLVTFKPNEDVKGYAAVAGEKGVIQEQYEMFAPMMGFKNFGDLVKGWGVAYDKEQTVTSWLTGFDPNTEYEVFVQAWDKNDTYAACDTISITTKKLGGPGKAEVKTSLTKYIMNDWNGEMLPSQFVKYEPNDQVSVWRMNVALDSLYQKDPEGYQREVAMDPPMPMVGWFFPGDEVLETDYPINPSTKFVVITAAKNSENEWGDVKVDSYETAASVMNEENRAPKKISSVTVPRSRFKTTSMPFFTPGRAPMLNTTKKENILIQKK